MSLLTIRKQQGGHQQRPAAVGGHGDELLRTRLESHQEAILQSKQH